MEKQPFIDQVRLNNPAQPEFVQTVSEIYDHVKLVLDKKPDLARLKILERMVEPERIISFRVTWVDDHGEVQVNRGYRVQMNSAIGPYKGGLRFDPTVNLSILKFLAFEQIFKNALTGLPLGAGKGGADFNPKGKSDQEVMQFCQNFIRELYRYIGSRIDIPAGDIGVGQREIGYMFGAYKKLKNEFTGSLTGKGVNWGGSLVRSEATGYGLIYFAHYMLEEKNQSLEGKKCIVSGSGNVAQHAIEKILEKGGIPVAVSDSSGFIYDEVGINREKLAFIMDLKNNQRGRIKEYADKFREASYQEVDHSQEHNPLWDIPVECAFPCATQNEIKEKDAQNLVKNKVQLLAEGANMPLTAEASQVILDSQILYAPGKASNAGGVAVSGLEMTQNHMGIYWDKPQLDERLQSIMKNIHTKCLNTAGNYGLKNNYLAGANIAGFLKVADSMVAEGIV
ncbi:MAG: NADP-specific glutamate dehydrogenase [Candidatus Cyclobacteriaceae bacterium M3_2C_046]